MVLNALPISGPHFPCPSNGVVIPVLPTSQGCLRDQRQAEQKELLDSGAGHGFQPSSDSRLASGRPQPLCGSFSHCQALVVIRRSGEVMDCRDLLFKPTSRQPSGSFLFNREKG